MGDPRRFRLFADLIARSFPDRDAAIADVASGKGKLQAELRRRGFTDVVSWDRRRRNAKPRGFYRYGYFDHRNAPREYRLVVGMHPDEATDHLILYAAKHRVPFVICPCCVKPSGAPYGGRRNHRYDWHAHLRGLAHRGRLHVTETALEMRGDARVMIGRPT